MNPKGTVSARRSEAWPLVSFELPVVSSTATKSQTDLSGPLGALSQVSSHRHPLQ